MQNNSNDNSTGWKQRLNAFEETDSVDLNASWQKLQQKTPPQKSDSKKGWYWLAAACITGITFLLININREEIQLPALVNVDTVNLNPEIEPLIIDNKPMVFENKKAIIVENKKPSQKQVQALPNKKEEPLQLLANQIAEIKEPTTGIDTGSQASIPVLAKAKKLRVVHINELNPTENNGFAQQQGKPYYPLSYKTKEVYGNANDNRTRNDRDNIIKIKLFP